MNKIYALIDPRTGAIRYVGKTKASIADRLRGHLSDADRRGNRIKRFAWINLLRDLGLLPTIELLEHVGDEWQEAEQRWIVKCRADGCVLLNATDGGDGTNGYRHTDEAKARNSASQRRRYEDPKERRKSGDAVRRALSTPEAKKNLSDALKIAFAKPEVKARLSAAQKLSCARPEVRKAKSDALKGRIISAEHRKKLSEFRTGRKLAPDVVARMAAGHVGLKHTEETLEKMRASFTPERRTAIAARFKEWRKANDTAEYRQAISERMTRLWAERHAAVAAKEAS